ncbi:hypothetical protein HY409_03885 [Candidatus Gottesmanbacteria bacterium]|nr:hypothetical protein [Candidatus Gottesmanbacteria bacterium]
MNPQNIYHGILVDAGFDDPSYPEAYKVFAKKKSTNKDWTLYGIEVEAPQLQDAIKNIQLHFKSDQSYYAHFYNDKELIVIFKNKVFSVTPQSVSWEEIIAFGKLLNIPGEQLDFWPNRFQDEIHYFKSEDFIQ